MRGCPGERVEEHVRQHLRHVGRQRDPHPGTSLRDDELHVRALGLDAQRLHRVGDDGVERFFDFVDRRVSADGAAGEIAGRAGAVLHDREGAIELLAGGPTRPRFGDPTEEDCQRVGDIVQRSVDVAVRITGRNVAPASCPARILTAVLHIPKLRHLRGRVTFSGTNMSHRTDL